MGPQSLYRRVYQIHDASPVKDRAVYLDYQLSDQCSQSSPKNFQKFGKWHLAFKRSPPSQELKIGADFVEVQENQGYWEVQDHPQGSQVIMESVYHPGGSVPGFLVRWFLGSGLQKMMDELRECAR